MRVVPLSCNCPMEIESLCQWLHGEWQTMSLYEGGGQNDGQTPPEVGEEGGDEEGDEERRYL